MGEPELELRVSAPVDTVVQVGRMVVTPPRGSLAGVPAALPGREPEIAAAVRMLEAHAAVLVHGVPGLGATAIALAAAVRAAPRFAGGARFVPEPSVAALLAALGRPAGPEEDPERVLREVLADHPTLLVVDRIGTAEQVRALLPRGRSALLAVAAGPLPELDLDGVVALPVGGLPRRAATEVTPGVAGAAAVLAACHGSPVALRLWAGSGAGPEAIARGLGLRELPGAGPLPASHTTALDAARAAARAALATLPVAERAVLHAAAAVVRAGSPLVDAATCRAMLAPHTPVEEPLRSLLERGLLSLRPGELTCAVPTAVLDVLPRPAAPAPPPSAGSPASAGPDRTVAVPGADANANQSADQSADRSADADLAVGGAVDAALALIAARLEDRSAPPDPVEAALAGVAAARDRAALLAATLTLAGALRAREGPGNLDRARRAYDTVVVGAAGRDDAVHAAALRDRGLLAYRRGRTAAALVDLRAAVALQHTLGAAAEAARTWQDIGEIELAAGHPCPAVTAHRSALAVLAELGDPVAVTWTTLATARRQLGAGAGRAPVGLPDTPATRSVLVLARLDPTAPDAQLVAALL
ncbi:hypothetical protein [Pseudonocardia xishanensis]|uniref:hypothetical protein n=1 Tax=Pseudonocardia xishanensis TaxID=630995 RepID=UPI0031EB3E82